MSSEITLLHGDCLDVMRDIPSGSVDAVITDPPYGMDYQSARRTDKDKRLPRIANDKQPFIWWLWDASRVLKEGGALLCFCRWDTQEAFRLALTWAGFNVRQHVIWDREWHGMADVRTMFAPQHDIIWQASKGRCELRGTRPKSVIRSRRIGGDQLLHPNEKPVDLMEQLILPVTDAGSVVLDPFMGSGTTGVACINTNRNFIGIELDAGYYEIAERRIAEAQGKAKQLTMEIAV